uniref:NADH-ubiquinone oxidoreductase chain 6 n=1 Tax=Halisarca harmelini TaxID=936147 RepID=E7E2L4_9METZ|nr:NADH dehydrogenase subunit 6 [Halisarca harmelini]ADT81740.1 NADH dehydrogenase subunit 6 [Halisarca harmelini]
MEGLFYLFALGVIFSGIMVISSLNPVHSVLWLIFAFTNASALFILLEVEFLAFIFLIVYVGAIAILFLFVIMMLNLTDFGYNINSDMSNYLPAGLVIGTVFLFEILIWHNHSEGYYLSSDCVPIYYNCVISSPNIEIIGRVLYTDFYYLFLLASFILLVAMIGAIVLTHEINIDIRRQDIFIQTSRQLWGS